MSPQQGLRTSNNEESYDFAGGVVWNRAVSRIPIFQLEQPSKRRMSASPKRVLSNRRIVPNSMFILAMITIIVTMLSFCDAAEHSVARRWNEALLTAIRNDFARPPVHARNLFHVSAAMWDAWAAYGGRSSVQQQQWLHIEEAALQTDDDEAIRLGREETISYAAYRLLRHRFLTSPGSDVSLPMFDELLENLGYDPWNNSTMGTSAAALGNRIAASYMEYGLNDGANEAADYASRVYAPVNPPLFPERRGNPRLQDPNRWQPLGLDVFVDQSGNSFPGGTPGFQSPEWGWVSPFSLTPKDLTIRTRDDGIDYWIYHDPGPPPKLMSKDAELYKEGFEQVVIWSGQLDPLVGAASMDISPASRGNNTLGTNDGKGYTVNPATGRPYEPQMVPAGDYFRVLAEFWADGPDSETPPGHWFTIANEVSDHPEFVPQVAGEGPILDPLEWDVKLYITLGGAMHDAAIAAWSAKGWYDYVRPISAIRYMASLGQCSDPNETSYHPDGINLYPGAIELITPETILPGARHEHLAGYRNAYVGKIAVRAWRGPSYIEDPESDTAGVGWILAENWWPYQRPSFVTPPFAAYVSGHSTFSRAAARVMTEMTGSDFFPGGMAEFHTVQDEFLVFEQGPSVNMTLQWARYFDAADECSISRIYGGIHPSADDIPGRLMGDTIGSQAVAKSLLLFSRKSMPRWHIILYVIASTCIAAIGVFYGFKWSRRRVLK